MQKIKQLIKEHGPIPLVVKAGWLAKRNVCRRTNLTKICRKEIMGLKKGDIAEVVGTWGPHDIYLDVFLHKYRDNVVLLPHEVNILFDRK